MNAVFQFDFKVTADVVDQNAHVNNVAYVQWLQDAAERHAASTGCIRLTLALGAAWVVRSHFIEYLAPAFAGETLTMQTWVVNFQKVRSRRKYKITRASDRAVVARAETEWVFVNSKTGRPMAIPDEVRNTLPLLNVEMEP